VDKKARKKALAGGETTRSPKRIERILKLLRASGQFTQEPPPPEWIPLAVPSLDRLFGGGIPRGKILEIYGDPQSGKTTIAALAARSFQERHQRVLYLDYEHAVDLFYLRECGVRMDSDALWLFDQPFSLESGMTAALKLIATGKIALLVVDSVAAMAPQVELDGNLDEATIAIQARQMGRALRSLLGLLNRTATAAIFLNQLRDKIGWTPNPYDRTTTPGGRALKFYASVRVELKKVAPASEEKSSSTHRAILRKQRLSSIQTAVAQFHIGNSGIDRNENLLRSLIETGAISEEESGFKFSGVNNLEFIGSYAECLEFVRTHHDDLSQVYLKAMETPE